MSYKTKPLHELNALMNGFVRFCKCFPFERLCAIGIVTDVATVFV